MRLVGRDQELEQALAGLGRVQKAVHFFGVYGVGKTRLAEEVFCHLVKNRKFKDGVIWLSVDHLEPASALEQIAAGLGILEVSQADTVGKKALALRRALSRHPDLLIGLDDVFDEATARVLLEATGTCPVILNGMYSTGLFDVVFESKLEPLTPERAVDLFSLWSGKGPDPANPRDTRHIREICGMVGCLPRGIALAAGKYREGEALEDILDLLQAAPEIFIDENPELNAVVSATYRGLKENDPHALALWMALASYPAYQASEERLEEEWLQDGMGRVQFLKARSKLLRLGLAQSAETGYLSLHPIIGRGLLQVEGETIRMRRARTFAKLLEFARGHREPNIASYTAIRGEQANLLALLDWYEDERQWDNMVLLLQGLFNYLRANGLWETAFSRLDRLVANVEQIQKPFLRGWIYLHRGIMHMLRSKLDNADSDFVSADSLFRNQKNQMYRGKVMYRRAQLMILKGSYRSAAKSLTTALEWMGDRLSRTEAQKNPERVASHYDRAGAHERLGFLLAEMGQPDQAIREYRKAIHLGEDDNVLRVRTALAELYRKQGSYKNAAAELELARGLSLRLNDLLHQGAIELELGYLAYFGTQKDVLQAGVHYAAARQLYQSLDYQAGLARVFHAMGLAALAQQNTDAAESLFREALKINKTTTNNPNTAYNLYHLGLIYRIQGKKRLAARIFTKVLDMTAASGTAALGNAAAEQLKEINFIFVPGRRKISIRAIVKPAAEPQQRIRPGELFEDQGQSSFEGKSRGTAKKKRPRSPNIEIHQINTTGRFSDIALVGMSNIRGE